MFLRRTKAAGTISRPAKQESGAEEPQKKAVKPLGGWDGSDDESSKDPDPGYAKKGSLASNAERNLLFEGEEVADRQAEDRSKGPQSTLYNYGELQDMATLEYETKLVDEILQPGGIKVKPNEAMLAEFAQAAKTLDKNLIGSLLVSRLEEGFPYAVKAKALYTMEHLARKNEEYREFFRLFLEEVRAHPAPTDNAASYATLLGDVTAYIEKGTQSTAVAASTQAPVEFRGPDYNQDLPWAQSQGPKIMSIKKEKEKEEGRKPAGGSVTKTFISPAELRRQKEAEKAQGQKVERGEKAEKGEREQGGDLLIDTGSAGQTEKGPDTRNPGGSSSGQFNIFDLDLSGNAPTQQPAPGSAATTQNVPLHNLYTTPIPSMQNLTPQQQLLQRQYQQQQHHQQQQQFLLLQQQQHQQQQQQLQHQQQQMAQNKVVTGADLYSMYKM